MTVNFAMTEGARAPTVDFPLPATNADCCFESAASIRLRRKEMGYPHADEARDLQMKPSTVKTSSV